MLAYGSDLGRRGARHQVTAVAALPHHNVALLEILALGGMEQVLLSKAQI